MSNYRKRAVQSTSIVLVAGLLLSIGILATAQTSVKSITSTSQNRSSAPPTMVAEQPLQRLAGYRVLAANDLGMHCGDLDTRIASILPPFNVLHAQAVKEGVQPRILSSSDVEMVYSAASNPSDPAKSGAVPPAIYKTNFWDLNPRGTGKPLGYDAYNAYYPPGVLQSFPLTPDMGLPVPDLQRLYLGDGQLAADRQAMPSSVAPPYTTQPYASNVPQRFSLYYNNLPFFIRFPFGYTLPARNWFAAEGIPATPFDDSGRMNPYPLMRVQARASATNMLGLRPGTVLASLDTVTPVSGEVNCGNCHTTVTDGGNGLATDGKGFTVATRFSDPLYGSVPQVVSIEYAFDLNIVRLHDKKHGTKLQNSTPVSCQKCHYTPALDLAHVGPKGPADADANGREQTLHQSFSRVMHTFHGKLTNPNGTPLFPPMPSPKSRSLSVRDGNLLQTCYQCHPGKVTKCFRGQMETAGQACQDCHGGMQQVGNDFSRNVSAGKPGAFVVAGDFYTNPATPRVPWANEPLCQSCHTGDALKNLATSANVIAAGDGIRLIQAYRTTDADSRPIVASNLRFAENQAGAKQVLYRASTGHGGVFCQGCHGSTHSEWPNAVAAANDNLAAMQLQGYTGKIMECSTCHGANTFSLTAFRGNFDANGWMKGPHGMHPVNDRMWGHSHSEVFEDSRTPAGTCQTCHGSQLQGSPLAEVSVDRSLECASTSRPGCKETPQGKRILLARGTQISCTLCHERP